MTANADDPGMTTDAEMDEFDEPDPETPIELSDLPEVDLYVLPEGKLGCSLQDIIALSEPPDE